MNREREEEDAAGPGEELPEHSRRATHADPALRPPAKGKPAAQLRAVIRGLAAIASPVAESVDAVLARIAAVAMELTSARYCALGIGTDPKRQFEPWVFIGMCDDEARAIGRTPRPVCLLGAVPRRGRPIRLSQMQKSRTFCGFPEHHPPMRSFLGVPIRLNNRSIGNLYLTEKVGAGEFSEVDQLVVEALAVHAGVAVESARLFEEARKRAAELEEERQQREVFVSAVSHELRGPISVLTGYSDLLPMWDRLPPERRERALTAIGDQARLMNRLIGDLLDTSRIQAGRFHIEPEETDLVEVTRRVVTAQQASPGDRAIRLDTPAKVELTADEARLGQALTNLISNALKYSPQGGDVFVKIAVEGDNAHVSVSDQGIGISAEQMPNLFQPYSRLNPERRVAAGVGLGLYITKGIVEAHGGRIWAESPGPDQGSTFHFTLALAR